MADPLGIIGAVSVVAAAANKLMTIVSNIHNAPTEISGLDSYVKSLTLVLESAKSLKEIGRPTEDVKPFVETVKQCLDVCERAIEPMETALKPLTADNIRGQSLMAKLQWSRKKDDIVLMKLRLVQALELLTAALTVLDRYVSGKGQDEMRRELIARMEKLHTDFERLDGKHLERKLAVDLETIAMPGRVSNYSMEDMLERQTRIQAPGSLVIGSLPSDLSESDLTAIIAVDDAEKVSELLSAGVLKLDKSLQGRTILHRCALFDAKNITGVVIEAGAPVDAKDVDRMTPLTICIRDQSWGVAALLIARQCSLKPLISKFFELAEAEDLSSVRPVLKALAERVRDSEDGPFFVHQVVERNEPKLLGLMLEEGFDANASEYGFSPIHVAAAMNHAACTSVLLRHGADPNAMASRTANESVGI